MDEKKAKEFSGRLVALFKEYGIEGKTLIEVEDSQPNTEAHATGRRCTRWGIDPRTGKRICVRWE